MVAVAQRKSPTQANGGSGNGVTYTNAVDAELQRLWEVSATWLATIGGTGNVITAASDTTQVVTIASYVRPMAFWYVPTLTNTGGVTIAIDSLAAKDVKDSDGATLTSGFFVVGRLYKLVYDGTNFRAFTASGSAASQYTVAPDAIFREEQTSGTSAGTFTSGSFATRLLNTTTYNTISGAALASNQITLQAGTYFVEWAAPAYEVASHQTQFYNVTDASVVETGESAEAGTGDSVYSRSGGCAKFTITSAKAFSLQHKCETTKATSGQGLASSMGAKEVYSYVKIWKVGTLAAQADGVPGGGTTFPILFSTTTTDADPGAGTMRLNNATQNTATAMYIDLSDANLTDITAILDDIAASGDKTSRATVKLSKYDDPTKWISFNVTAWTTASGYRKLTVVKIGQSAASPFANGDQLIFSQSKTGQRGADGATSILYTFSTTTTDSDPGAGVLRLDNATQESATTIRADLTDTFGIDWTGVLDTIDSGTSSVKANIRLTKLYDSTAWLAFDLSARASPSGYRNLTVANTGKSGTSPFTNGDLIVFSSTKVGDKGTTGATGSVGTLTAASVGSSMINGTLVASVAASALTIAIKGQDGNNPDNVNNKVRIVFRDQTAASGSFDLVEITAATSFVVSSGSTIGAGTAPFNIWILGFNDGGTFRLGVFKSRSGTTIASLTGWGIASSTAEGGAGAADSSQVIYTGTAVTNKPFVVLGYFSWESGLSVGGTWDAAPTRGRLYNQDCPLPGSYVQHQGNTTGAVATGTTTLPFDDTIPQSGEGIQFMTQGITATSASNLFEVEWGAQLAIQSSGLITSALFQDSGADAISAVMMRWDADSLTNPRHLFFHRGLYLAIATTTSATTFKLRAGCNAAGTVTFNGAGGSRELGGVLASFLNVKEIMT